MVIRPVIIVVTAAAEHRNCFTFRLSRDEKTNHQRRRLQANMKPQALQDAIKGLALKKKEKGEWKDPYVKKYTITKEDYLKEKERFGMSPMARSLEVPSQGPVDSTMLAQMQALLQQMQAEKYDWKKERDSLLKEMSEMKSQMKGAGSSSGPSDYSSAEVSSLRSELKELKLDVEKLQKTSAKEIETLRQELTAAKSHTVSASSTSSSDYSSSEIDSLKRELQLLRLATKDLHELKDEISKLKAKASVTTISSSGSDDIDDLRDGLSTLKTKMVSSKDIDDLRKEIAGLKLTRRARSSTPARTAASPEPLNSPTSPGGGLSSIDVTKTPLKSPHKRGKEKSTLPSCKPHTVQELSDGQRKDKLLKDYLRTKSGLPFLYKSMSIPDYKNEEGETKHLVCFDNRLYIPKKLRASTMEYYVQHHPYDSYTAMEKHCIWPDCEDETKEFKKNRK